MVAMSEGGISVTSHKSQVTNDHEKAIKKSFIPKGRKIRGTTQFHSCITAQVFTGTPAKP